MHRLLVLLAMIVLIAAAPARADEASKVLDRIADAYHKRTELVVDGDMMFDFKEDSGRRAGKQSFELVYAKPLRFYYHAHGNDSESPTSKLFDVHVVSDGKQVRRWFGEPKVYYEWDVQKSGALQFRRAFTSGFGGGFLLPLFDGDARAFVSQLTVDIKALRISVEANNLVLAADHPNEPNTHLTGSIGFDPQTHLISRLAVQVTDGKRKAGYQINYFYPKNKANSAALLKTAPPAGYQRVKE
jgi:hypothetical protein